MKQCKLQRVLECYEMWMLQLLFEWTYYLVCCLYLISLHENSECERRLEQFISLYLWGYKVMWRCYEFKHSLGLKSFSVLYMSLICSGQERRISRNSVGRRICIFKICFSLLKRICSFSVSGRGDHTAVWTEFFVAGILWKFWSKNIPCASRYISEKVVQRSYITIIVFCTDADNIKMMMIIKNAECLRTQQGQKSCPVSSSAMWQSVCPHW